MWSIEWGREGGRAGPLEPGRVAARTHHYHSSPLDTHTQYCHHSWSTPSPWFSAHMEGAWVLDTTLKANAFDWIQQIGPRKYNVRFRFINKWSLTWSFLAFADKLKWVQTGAVQHAAEWVGLTLPAELLQVPGRAAQMCGVTLPRLRLHSSLCLSGGKNSNEGELPKHNRPVNNLQFYF